MSDELSTDPVLAAISETFFKAAAPKADSSTESVTVPSQLPPLEVSPRATASAYPGSGSSANLPGLKAFVEGVRT